MGLSKIKDKVRSKSNREINITTSSSAEVTYGTGTITSREATPRYNIPKAQANSPSNTTYKSYTPNPIHPDYAPSHLNPLSSYSYSSSSYDYNPIDPYTTYSPSPSPYVAPPNVNAASYIFMRKPGANPFPEHNGLHAAERERSRRRRSGEVYEDGAADEETILEDSLEVGETEQERSAEERRKIVREYLRYERDNSRYNTTSGRF